MAANIYTKAFIDPQKWMNACWLIGVIDPSSLEALIGSGGIPADSETGKSAKEPVDERNPDGSGVWTRRDYGAKRYRMPTAEGPKPEFVTKRITTDLETGEVVETKNDLFKVKNKGTLFVEIPGGR